MREATARYRVPPQVVLLGMAAFLNDASSDIIFPLLPIFLTTQLGATPAALGIIEGAADALASVFKLLAGAWSDRMPRRKPLVLSGYLLAALSRIAIPFATRWPTVLAARLVDRTGKGIRTAPRDALIADVTPPEHWGRAFGMHRAFDHAGAVAGPLLAALMVGPLQLPLRQIFLIAAAPAFAAVLLLVFRLKEPPKAEAVPGAPALGTAVSLPPEFWRSLIGIALFALANSSDAFLILMAFDAGVSPTNIALLWAAHHAVKVLLSTHAGALSDRIDRRYLLISGWFLYAVVYLAFPFTSSLGAFLVLFLIYALPFAMTEGAERAWISAPVDASIRGKAFGVYHLTVGLFTLLGTVTFGAVYQTGGRVRAFHLAAGLALLAVLSVATQKNARRRD